MQEHQAERSAEVNLRSGWTMKEKEADPPNASPDAPPNAPPDGSPAPAGAFALEGPAPLELALLELVPLELLPLGPAPLGPAVAAGGASPEKEGSRPLAEGAAAKREAIEKAITSGGMPSGGWGISGSHSVSVAASCLQRGQGRAW